MADQPRRPFNLAVVLKIAAIPLVVLLVAAVIVDRLMDSPRDDCIPLEVNSGTEKGELLAAIAEDYNAAGRTFGDDRCAAVSVHEVTSGAAMEALAAGWDPDREGAPEPQVWTPTSSLWLDVLAQRGDSADRTLAPEDDVDSITKSPLVIAMPRPMAEALGWPDTQVGWADILELSSDPDGWGSHDHSEWGRFSLGKDNPHLSTSGMAATIATFYAASGLSHDLTEADVADPDRRAVTSAAERGLRAWLFRRQARPGADLHPPFPGRRHPERRARRRLHRIQQHVGRMETAAPPGTRPRRFQSHLGFPVAPPRPSPGN